MREMIGLDEALERVLGSLASRVPEHETIALGQCVGRVLVDAVACAEDVPAADNSAMDGFAVRAADVPDGGELRLVGQSLAGSPHEGKLEPGTCTRIMTGGLVPEGADAVVPVERTSGYEPKAGGVVEVSGPIRSGDHIRPKGSVRAAGAKLLAAGTRIRPGHIGVLAQQGYAEVRVGRRPKVAILPTGDEVVEVDQTPGLGQVRNSNAYALVAQVEAAGGVATRLPILRDAEGDTDEKLAAALAENDLVCTIGGVSMGTRDLVRGAFEKLGGETIVESVRIKPGKPTLFGRVEHAGRERFVLGLPGNPASTFTIFQLLGAPWVEAFQGVPTDRVGATQRASLWFSKVRPNWRLQALPARLALRVEGVVVEELPQKSSADLFSLADADVLFLVPEDKGPRDGDLVDWLELP